MSRRTLGAEGVGDGEIPDRLLSDLDALIDNIILLEADKVYRKTYQTAYDLPSKEWNGCTGKAFAEDAADKAKTIYRNSINKSKFMSAIENHLHHFSASRNFRSANPERSSRKIEKSDIRVELKRMLKLSHDLDECVTNLPPEAKKYLNDWSPAHSLLLSNVLEKFEPLQSNDKVKYTRSHGKATDAELAITFRKIKVARSGDKEKTVPFDDKATDVHIALMARGVAEAMIFHLHIKPTSTTISHFRQILELILHFYSDEVVPPTQSLSRRAEQIK